jgi:prepilin-type N-terminal cleavage/methylation domain-containing protein
LPGARGGSAGFTLVELMIVVAIIAILAGVALPAFGRYTKKAHTSEAVVIMEKIIAGAVAYYETDHVDPAGNTVDKQYPFPIVGGELTEPNCCTYPGEKCPPSLPLFDTDPVWMALGFRMANPHRFAAGYLPATPELIHARARGDLDCDGTQSLFSRQLAVAADGSPRMTPALYIERELE